jgi:hypothetical protein
MIVLKFTTASITDGNLQVAGPAGSDSGLPVKHLRFLVAQGDAMVENVYETRTWVEPI